VGTSRRGPAVSGETPGAATLNDSTVELDEQSQIARATAGPGGPPSLGTIGHHAFLANAIPKPGS